MFQMLVVTLREGIEAFLIVAIAEWAEGAHAQIYAALLVLAPLAWLSWRSRGQRHAG